MGEYPTEVLVATKKAAFAGSRTLGELVEAHIAAASNAVIWITSHGECLIPRKRFHKNLPKLTG